MLNLSCQHFALYSNDLVMFFCVALDHTIQRDSDYHFRYKMKYLADRVSPGDLEKLKSECHGHISPDKLEKVNSTILLWKELQDCNIITTNNTEFLKHLFTKINKQRLLEEVFGSTTASNAVGSQDPGPSAPHEVLDPNIGSLGTWCLNSLQDGSSHGEVHCVLQVVFLCCTVILKMVGLCLQPCSTLII